jgi:hypothetical protein
MLASLAVFVVVSLLTPRPDPEELARWDRRLKVSGPDDAAAPRP